MGLIETVSRFLSRQKAVPMTGPNMRGFPSLGPVVYDANNPENYVTKGYSANSTVYAIVKLITRKASVAPWGVYKVKAESNLKRYKAMCSAGITASNIGDILIEKSRALELVKSHTKLHELLDQPNPEQSWSDFIENTIGFRLITGNDYTYAVLLDGGANTGKPQYLVALPSQFMQIKTSGAGLFKTVEGYQYSCGEIIQVPKEFVLHGKYWNPNHDLYGSHLYGFSPLQAAWLDVQRDNDSKKAALKLMQNVGAMGIAYVDDSGQSTYTQQYSQFAKEQADLVKKKWREERKGTDFERAGDIILAATKMGYTKIGMTADEMKILEASDYSQDDLCNVYGVDSTLLNSQNKTFENVKTAQRGLVSSCAVPELIKTRDGLNRKLQSDWGFKNEGIFLDVDLSVYPELMENRKDMAQALDLQYYYTPNEKRILCGDEVLDDALMNQIWMPSNLVPMNQPDNAGLMKYLEGINDYK